jgi:hypothetical protein
MPVFGASGGRAIAQSVDFKPVAEAPGAWRAFAAELQGRLQDRLASDNEATRQFHEFMEQSGKGTQASVVIRTWVAPSGKVERVEFDGVDDASVAVSLRAVLASTTVSAPPPDMSQPLRLRLALQPLHPEDR